MVIIITTARDAHVPFVTKHLQNEYITIDAGAVLDGRELTFHIAQDGSLQIVYQGKEITEAEVTGVWLRRPGFIDGKLKTKVDPGYIDYSRSALLNLADQLYSLLPDATWVSDHFAIERAENKVFQLVTAKRNGFEIPETIFTSSSTDARKFVEKHGEVIVKTLSNQWPDPENGKQKVFYAKKIKHTDAIDYNGLHIAPVIFQELVAPRFELRVTVIGDRVFGVRVDAASHDRPGVRDWRFGQLKGEAGVSFNTYNMPDTLAKKCLALTKKLGLTYGAIDLVQDENGTIWFLEINPNGQWAFVEEKTGQPLGETMAKLLEGRL